MISGLRHVSASKAPTEIALMRTVPAAFQPVTGFWNWPTLPWDIRNLPKRRRLLRQRPLLVRTLSPRRNHIRVNAGPFFFAFGYPVISERRPRTDVHTSEKSGWALILNMSLGKSLCRPFLHPSAPKLAPRPRDFKDDVFKRRKARNY